MPVLLIAIELARRNDLSSQESSKSTLESTLTSQKLCSLASGRADNFLIHLYKLGKSFFLRNRSPISHPSHNEID